MTRHDARRPCLPLIAIVFVVACAGGGPRGDDPWLVVPGVRIGPVTRTSSEAALRAALGPEHVRSERLYLGEGDYVLGTVLYGEDPERSVAITWHDAAARSAPEAVAVGGIWREDVSITRSRWHTEEGITIGTSLREIEKLNGRPVYLVTGFETDCGFGIAHGDGGRLSFLGTSTRPSQDGFTEVEGRTLAIGLTVEGAEQLPKPDYERLSGCRDDRRSDDPVLRRLEWSVDEIRLQFE